MSNRIIKFRALKDDISNCNFMYGQLVYDAIGTPRITNVDKSGKGLTFHSCLKGTEGQFTGLTDKNGTEIYEGDIVVCGYGTGKVFFSNGCFVVSWINDISSDMELLACNKSGRYFRKGDEMFEIIGNIHSNPELI